jgi:hypothetical protein
MKKLESVVNGFLGCGKTRPIATFPQILPGLLSFILPKIFTMKGERDGRRKRPPSPFPLCSGAFKAFYSCLFDNTNNKITIKGGIRYYETLRGNGSPFKQHIYRILGSAMRTTTGYSKGDFPTNSLSFLKSWSLMRRRLWESLSSLLSIGIGWWMG